MITPINIYNRNKTSDRKFEENTSKDKGNIQLGII